MGKGEETVIKRERGGNIRKKGLENRYRKRSEKRRNIKLLKDRKEKQRWSTMVNKVRTNGKIKDYVKNVTKSVAVIYLG